jgi:RNA polymerase sigma factor (sigma-70 family)
MSGKRRSDADLVREALGGSREPLSELLRRHFATAVFLATRMLGSPELARDAAQEAAIAAMTDLDRLRSPDRFGAWFCGIALNVARRWRRELRSELLGLPCDVVSPAPGPAEAAELADIAARVRGAIAALPDGQRNAVLLFYLQGLSHREVAAELGISVGAVKARLHQARVSLAPRLASVADFQEETTMTTEAAEWIDVSVSEIRRSHGDDEDEWQRKFVMVLAERDGDRKLPIWIGPAEAISLAMELESAETPRPFTYKLAAGLVGAAGAQVAEVRVTRLIEEVFYASVLVDGPVGRREVDSRPSDAVNLALAAGAPIKVEAGLLRSEQAAGRAGELASLPVATTEIAAEAQQRIRERHWHVCGPGTADPAT